MERRLRVLEFQPLRLTPASADSREFFRLKLQNSLSPAEVVMKLRGLN